MEGQGGGSIPLRLTVLVRTNTEIDQAFAVDWRVQGVGANPVGASDFVGGVLPSGRINIAAGQPQNHEIVLPVLGDASPEADEHYQIVLTAPAGLHTHTNMFSIRNDDGPWPG